MAPRPGINLGDGANTAKYKMGLRQAEYHSAWRKLNTYAQNLCREKYGTPTLSKSFTLGACLALREHYETRQDVDNDPLTHDVVAKAIKTEGAVGWLIHRAIKSNYAKHRAALIAAENDAAKSVPGAGGDVGTGQGEPRVDAPVEGNVSKTVMWDPVRDV